MRPLIIRIVYWFPICSTPALLSIAKEFLEILNIPTGSEQTKHYVTRLDAWNNYLNWHIGHSFFNESKNANKRKIHALQTLENDLPCKYSRERKRMRFQRELPVCSTFLLPIESSLYFCFCCRIEDRYHPIIVYRSPFSFFASLLRFSITVSTRLLEVITQRHALLVCARCNQHVKCVCAPWKRNGIWYARDCWMLLNQSSVHLHNVVGAHVLR